MEEFTFKEVELIRIKLEPGEVLAVKIFSDDADSEYLDAFRKSIQGFFPNNNVLLFLFSREDNMTMEAIKPIEQVRNCSTTSYCLDCNCGKKEAAEG